MTVYVLVFEYLDGRVDIGDIYINEKEVIETCNKANAINDNHNNPWGNAYYMTREVKGI